MSEWESRDRSQVCVTLKVRLPPPYYSIALEGRLEKRSSLSFPICEREVISLHSWEVRENSMSSHTTPAGFVEGSFKPRSLYSPVCTGHFNCLMACLPKLGQETIHWLSSYTAHFKENGLLHYVLQCQSKRMGHHHGKFREKVFGGYVTLGDHVLLPLI